MPKLLATEVENLTPRGIVLRTWRLFAQSALNYATLFDIRAPVNLVFGQTNDVNTRDKPITGTVMTYTDENEGVDIPLAIGTFSYDYAVPVFMPHGWHVASYGRRHHTSRGVYDSCITLIPMVKPYCVYETMLKGLSRKARIILAARLTGEIEAFPMDNQTGRIDEAIRLVRDRYVAEWVAQAPTEVTDEFLVKEFETFMHHFVNGTQSPPESLHPKLYGKYIPAPEKKHRAAYVRRSVPLSQRAFNQPDQPPDFFPDFLAQTLYEEIIAHKAVAYVSGRDM